MSEPRCAKCVMKEKYDKNPRSFLGRLWRWHINWCPSWRSYMKGLSDEERNSIVALYELPPDKWSSSSLFH